MILLFSTPSPASITDQIQSRLLRLAALFLLITGVILTLAPAVRLHSWIAPYRWQHWAGFAAWLVAFAVIHRESRRWLPERDGFLIPIAALLSGWGLMTIWRLSPEFGLRQTIWLVVCAAVFVVGMRIPNLLLLLKRYKYLWLVSALALTALTFFFGTYPGGTGPRLWLGCCGFYLQPSEPLKLFLIAYLAAYLADSMLISFSLTRLLAPTLVLLGTAAAVLVGQRDLGTAILVLFLYAAILYLATGLKRVAVASLALMAAGSAAAYLSFDVVRLRMDAWINPWLDPGGRSYQIIQSLISIAEGGLFGRGAGLGSPGLVPVAHSDFIFTAMTEEAGLAGALAILVLVCLVFARGMRAAFRAPEPYQRILAAGLTCFLTAQSLLIIGGNLRLFPLTGVTLPFVSYGGSSLLISFISLLLLVQISHQPDQEPARLPAPLPYLSLGGAMLVGLAAAGLLAGWWAFYRSPSLVERYDNPRRAISDRFVRRGSLLDRNDNALSFTSGQPGDFTRETGYPPLSSVLGYTSAAYGLAGLESGLDPYLRGLQGNPSSLVEWNGLVYSQPPPGLDTRLTLDLNLQRLADQAFGETAGGLALLNARTGEILAMASHPNIDPSRLDADWGTLVSDPRAPLLNRATQGQYQPGTALGPFLLAEAARRGSLPTQPKELTFSMDGETLVCSQRVALAAGWGEQVGSGCPGALAALGRELGDAGLISLFRRLGFFAAPSFQLPTAGQPEPAGIPDPAQAAVGRSDLRVSPLQIALAASGLSAGGLRPAPRIAISIHTPDQGWIVLPNQGEAVQEYPDPFPSSIVATLAAPGELYWQALAQAPNGQNGLVTWYLGGTLPRWQGTPYALALVLETDDVSLARQIGASVLESALQIRPTP